MAVVSFTRRGSACKFTGGNGPEILAMLSDHETLDNCTVQLIDEGDGKWLLQHTQPGEPPFALIRNLEPGHWVLVEMNRDVTVLVTDQQVNLCYLVEPAGQ